MIIETDSKMLASLLVGSGARKRRPSRRPWTLERTETPMARGMTESHGLVEGNLGSSYDPRRIRPYRALEAIEMVRESNVE